MNLNAFSRTALLLSAAAFLLPATAAPKSISVPTRAKTANAAAPFGALDGIIFKDCAYTVLTAKATSYRYSEDGAYDHTIILRFHRDGKLMDMRLLYPGENWNGWTKNDTGFPYLTPTAPAPGAGRQEQEWYKKGKLHYTSVEAEEEGMDGLQLHVQSVGKVTRNAKGLPTCKLRLIGSSYTYSVGFKLHIFEFAEEVVIEGSNQKIGK